MPVRMNVRMAVYDARGMLVAVSVNQIRSFEERTVAQDHSWRTLGRDLASL